MSTAKEKKRFLEGLKENHIVLATCRKTGISKSAYYRWRQSDQKFAKAADAAIDEGVQLVNDAAESNVVMGVKDRDDDMTKFWLTHRHPAFSSRLMQAGAALAGDDDRETILQIFATLKPKTRAMLAPYLSKKSKRKNHRG
ncbi:MAG: hypothetical protein KGH79_02120 [Patescibacteria group bacterium]|nr:hypothetical protein [Patescibacteria group bacterium]